MEDICEVVTTAEDAEQLSVFVRKAIETRLAACGQQIASIRSLYRWDGEVQDEPEARVALHTRLSLAPELFELARREHPYETPCLIALPIAAAAPDYQRWVIEETKSPER